jgi:hypothetical protein
VGAEEEDAEPRVFVFLNCFVLDKKIIIGDGQKSAPAGVQDWT